MRLNICVCTNRPAPPQFTLSLTHLLATLGGDSGPFETVGLQIKSNTSVLPIGRHASVYASIDAGFTHVLFIDDDSSFPANAAHRLVAHAKRIVGVNFVKKVEETHYCALGLDGKEMVSRGRKGLERALRLGFGMAMIDLDVFKKVPPPHFEIAWNGRTYTGEDHSFSKRVRDYGEELWIDHDLSASCGHIGDKVYAFDRRAVPVVSGV